MSSIDRAPVGLRRFDLHLVDHDGVPDPWARDDADLFTRTALALRDDALVDQGLRQLLHRLGHVQIHRLQYDAVVTAVARQIQLGTVALTPTPTRWEWAEQARARAVAADASQGSPEVAEAISASEAGTSASRTVDRNVAASPAPMARSPSRVDAPVPRFYDSIDPLAAPPAGWIFHDERESATELRTRVFAPDGAKGHILRQFNAASREWVMKEAFFDSTLPRWIESDPPMVPGRGTPLIAYLDLRQMKAFGIGAGTLNTAKLSNVQNVEAICQLAANLRNRMTLDAALRNTHSVKYAETELIQSGHRIRSVRLLGGVHEGFDSMLAHYERQRQRTPAEYDAILKQYGVKRTDPVLWGFDVHLELEPFRHGA